MTAPEAKNGGHKRAKAIVKTAAREILRKGALLWSRQLLWVVGFAIAVAFLVVGGIRLRQSGEQFQDAARAVTRSREVLEKVAEISTRLTEVESSARSFAISGKQSHLDPFYTAAKAVPQQVDGLKQLLKNNPAQLKTLTGVEPAIARHLKVMKDMVELGSRNLFRGSGQRGLTDEGSKLMEQIRTAFSTIEKEQRAQLEKDQAALESQAQRLAPSSFIETILTGVIVVGCGVFAIVSIRGRRKAEEKLDRLLGSMPDALIIVSPDGKIVRSNAHAEKLFGYSDQELQGENMALLVPERFRQTQRLHYSGYFSQRNGRAPATTLELLGLHKDGHEFPVEVSTKPLATDNGLVVTSTIRDISERKHAEEQISRLNRELQNRALELEAANKELEAFSYSVSHDLRSPLQNIDSFSQILIEDYSNRLNADGRDYVQRLRASCQHMEQIIDALLALSNMMRSELTVEPFDLSALAKTVAADLKQKNPDRLADWVIADGLTAEGDAQLLRVVLENLFGNAWKFTAQRPRARIEFGALPQSNGARTYFVRDNGAGFDMTRAGNLFKPFKRLHDQSEFRGTGIGLATVQRVIHRHHGKIWAEGFVNQGATFCFTLTGDGGISNGKLLEARERR
jgi:PAS domain S-box-containing protein